MAWLPRSSLYKAHLLTYWLEPPDPRLTAHSCLAALTNTGTLLSMLHRGHLMGSQKPLPKPVVEAQLIRTMNCCSSSTGCCWKKGLERKKSFKEFGALLDFYLPQLFFLEAQSDTFISIAIHQAVATRVPLAQGEDSTRMGKYESLDFSQYLL